MYFKFLKIRGCWLAKEIFAHVALEHRDSYYQYIVYNSRFLFNLCKLKILSYKYCQVCVSVHVTWRW